MDNPSKFKKLADGLKAVFAEFTGQTVKFQEVKATDGSILSYDGEMPMAGAPIFIMDEAGQRLPAPTADYILEDGSTLKIQDGVIMEVVAGAEAPVEQNQDPAKVEQAEAPPAQNTATQAPSVPKTVVESIIKEYRFQEQLDEVRALLELKDKTIAELTEKFATSQAEVTKITEAFTKMSELVDKIADQPADESTPEKKDGFKKTKKEVSGTDEVTEFRKKHLQNQF